MQLLSKMIHLATTKHDGQFDKSGKPYILHPLKVMHYLKSDDEGLMCIALGHDLLEDTDVIYTNLIDMFGGRIADGIYALTKRVGQHYGEYKMGIFNNRDAILVKMADLRHNTDIRRLKTTDGKITPKDVERTVEYHNFYLELGEKLKQIDNSDSPQGGYNVSSSL